MKYFDWLYRLNGRGKAQKAGDIVEAPLLPLDVVLFPDSAMPVTIYGKTWHKLISCCWLQDSVLCVSLSCGSPGLRLGEPVITEVNTVGVLARIVSQQENDGSKAVSLILRGIRRFKLLDEWIGEEGWPVARIQILPEAKRIAIKKHLRTLLPLLREIVADLGTERILPPHDYEDAGWTSYRFCEVLPIQALARQKLLELDDPLERLEIIYRYMREHGLLKGLP